MAPSPSCVNHYALVVPPQNVKAVKTFLEKHRILDKSRKITPYSTSISDAGTPGQSHSSEPPKRLVLPLLPHGPGTDSPLDEEDGQDLETPLGSLAPLLESHLGRAAYDSISIVNLSTSISPLGTPSTAQPTNPLRAAFRSALTTLPPEALDHLSLTPDLLAAALPATYSIYPPLLLLPAHTFRHPSWTALLTTHPLTSPTTHTLLAHVGTTLHVTHIALNAPIALTTPHPNILRAPTSLTPLHGPWPPLAAATPAPALWASARQNGINQTWAPAYTMFSRGNVKEKARLLALPSVAAAAAGGCAAVDLYAGIGYFAFSYRRAGVATVLAWEINAWSVEGLRRGAVGNGWAVGVVVPGAGGGVVGVEALLRERDFVVFLESNEEAAARVERVRGLVPPVRHVNAGLLPSSRGAWGTAVRVLDPGLGGWVHLHENFGVVEVERRADEVVIEVRRIWRVVRAERWGDGEAALEDTDGDGEDAVKLEHVERVKTYAPGVLHCVLDIWISPTGQKPNE